MQSKNKRSIAKKLQTPEFKSEGEEATWYAANQDALLSEFTDAAKNGTLGRGTLAKRGIAERLLNHSASGLGGWIGSSQQRLS